MTKPPALLPGVSRVGDASTPPWSVWRRLSEYRSVQPHTHVRPGQARLRRRVDPLPWCMSALEAEDLAAYLADVAAARRSGAPGHRCLHGRTKINAAVVPTEATTNPITMTGPGSTIADMALMVTNPAPLRIIGFLIPATPNRDPTKTSGGVKTIKGPHAFLLKIKSGRLHIIPFNPPPVLNPPVSSPTPAF